MFGFSTTETILVIFVIYLGGKDLVKILAIFPAFAPLAKALEKILPKNGNGNGTNLKDMMLELKEHYNEETTVVLHRIESTLSEGFKDLTDKVEDVHKEILRQKK